MSMEDLLRAILGGAGAQTTPERSGRPAQASGDPLADILGSILGGGAPGSGAGEELPAGMGGLGDILNAIMGGGGLPAEAEMPGGGEPGAAGGLGDILNAIMGGGMGGGMASETAGIEAGGIGALFAPMISQLAAKLGLPAELAQVIVTFVMTKLLGGAMTAAGGAGSGYAQPAQGSGLNLDDLLSRMSSGEGLDERYLRSTGLTQELAAQTGLDARTATRSLQEVFGMLGERMAAGQDSAESASEQDSGLDNLLDKF